MVCANTLAWFNIDCSLGIMIWPHVVLAIISFITAGARDATRIFEDDKLKCESDLATAMTKSSPWDLMPSCRSYLVRLAVHEFVPEDKVQLLPSELPDPSLSLELSSSDMSGGTHKGTHKLSVSSKSHLHTKHLRAALATQLGSQDVISDLISSAKAGPLDYKFAVAGGKSGSGFASMGNFPVKYGLRKGDGTFKYMNEPHNFEMMAPWLTDRFNESNEDGEFNNQRMPSLLNKIYMMLELEVGSGPKGHKHFVLILEDALYGLPQVASRYGIPTMKFDLKGRSRIEGNRKFVETFPRTNPPNDKWGGRLPLSRTACNYFLSALMVDTLEVFGKLEKKLPKPSFIIDYSLFVGVIDLRSIQSRVAAYELEKRCAVVGEPLCFTVQPNEHTRPLIVTFSIIDYLNDLNDSKEMESRLIGLQQWMKGEGYQAKFHLYARQIVDFATSICYSTAHFEHVMNMLEDTEDMEEWFGSKEHLSALARSW